MPSLPGIHHVTAITGDLQGNVDFYVGLLGLRFVKRTVNFDDPGSYHLYYGDGLGHPGSVMTFFAWPGAPIGRQGTGQVATTAFSVPPGSLDWWARRLEEAGAPVAGVAPRMGDEVLAFEDLEGLRLELVAPLRPDPREGWAGGGVPAEHAIRGFHSVTLAVPEHGASARLLTETLGMHASSVEGGRARFGTGQAGGVVDLLATPEVAEGDTAAGTVHHVAFRTADDASQLAWRATIAGSGLDVTEVRDRQYFRSIYFREPGGVLFEIATDGPGFAVDEPADRLGTTLRLPLWLEPLRSQLEPRLPAISTPAPWRRAD